LWRGYSVQQFVDQVFGNHDDPSKGRQLPVHHSARWLHLVSVSSPVGTQIPQAAGAAYAARLQGKDDVTMVMFGEGATSTGEFHVGMNFAAVWKAPCVLVCRNNGWAASVPSAAQTAARTFAAKAAGYGMPGVRVDGGDAIAVWQVASEAIDRARRGDGPTLIEVLIRSAGPASMAAPGTDRDAEAGAGALRADPQSAGVPGLPAPGDRRDPRNRLRNYLRHLGLWNERWEVELAERFHRQVDDAIAAAERKRAPAVETLFDDVYEQPPWHLREQRAELLAQPRAANPHPGQR
jgi:pyruvate dehydrogenase E1 component alpha subunit